MKKMIFIISMLSVFGNCKKSQSLVNLPIEPIDTTQLTTDTFIIALGKSFVIKNGTTWNIPFDAWYYRADTLFQIRAKIVYSNLMGENFFIRDIPCEAGKYPIEFFPALENLNNRIPEAAFFITQDYDQPMGDYLVDTTRTDHFVEVIRYDSIAKTVEGRFQVFLGKKPVDVPWPGAPDSVFFTRGKFHLKIQDP